MSMNLRFFKYTWTWWWVGSYDFNLSPLRSEVGSNGNKWNDFEKFEGDWEQLG